MSQPSKSRPTKQRQIVVLGFSYVGKTAICLRFTKNRFDEHYQATYENNFSKIFHYNGRDIECIIKDTQGLNDQDVVRSEYGLYYHGYVLVYDISDKRSFETLQSINAHIQDLTGTTKNLARVLVGNKADLDSKHRREVTWEEGKRTADTWGCAFVECSAKDNECIDEVFEKLLDEIDKISEPEPLATTGSKCLDMCLCKWDEMSASSSDSGRMEKVVQLMIVLTMVTGLVAILLGIVIGIRTSNHQEQDGEILAYILFGFGFITSLVSVFGLSGVRQSSQEFLRVYSVSLVVILLTQIVVWAILYEHVSLFRDYIAPAAGGTTAVIILEVVSVVFTCCYQNLLAAHADRNTIPLDYSSLYNVAYREP